MEIDLEEHAASLTQYILIICIKHWDFLSKLDFYVEKCDTLAV